MLSADMIAESTGLKLKEILKINYSLSEVRFEEPEYLYESKMMCSDCSIPEFTPEEIDVKKKYNNNLEN